jgi:hypothetical protein
VALAVSRGAGAACYPTLGGRLHVYTSVVALHGILLVVHADSSCSQGLCWHGTCGRQGCLAASWCCTPTMVLMYVGALIP